MLESHSLLEDDVLLSKLRQCRFVRIIEKETLETSFFNEAHVRLIPFFFQMVVSLRPFAIHILRCLHSTCTEWTSDKHGSTGCFMWIPEVQ